MSVSRKRQIPIWGGIVLAGFLALALVACRTDGDKLVIAVQPASTAAELSADAGDLERFLEERLDVDVEMRFPTNYAGVIEALRFGHADAAFMGAWPAALAVEEAGADVALAEIRDVIIDGQRTEAPYYFSYWVVPKDSPYTSLEELRGKRAAFPSPLSTSGFVAPMARLVELGLMSGGDGGVDPKDFFSDAFFAGGYAQAWQALSAGQVDVSVIAGDVPEALYREVLANARVIDQQGPIPSHAVVFSKDLKDPVRRQLIEALTELGEPAYRELMRRFISGIFVRFQPTTNEQHLASLDRFLDATGLAFVESDQRAEPKADPDPDPELDPEPDPEAP